MLARLNSEEAGLGDTDNSRLPILDGDYLPDHCRITAKTPLPKAMADDHGRLRRVNLIILSRDRATDRGCGAERRENIATDFLCANDLRLCAVSLHETFGNISNSEEAGDAMAAIAKLFVQRVREVVGRAVAIDRRQESQFARGLNWQLAQQQCVYHAEDGRVRPDAEREREYDHDGEAFVLEQHSHAVTQVLNHFVFPSKLL